MLNDEEEKRENTYNRKGDAPSKDVTGATEETGEDPTWYLRVSQSKSALAAKRAATAAAAKKRV